MNDAFDEALERLRGTGTEVAGGIAPNHGPMGAEALVALGRDDAVVAWADRYRRNLDLMPASNAPITKEMWREGLGVIERIGDWVVFFARNWLRTLGVPYLQSGSAVCCPRRLRQAPMASSAPRTLSARCSTPRRRCA
jgi:hypothetical protein